MDLPLRLLWVIHRKWNQSTKLDTLSDEEAVGKERQGWLLTALESLPLKKLKLAKKREKEEKPE